MGSILFKGADRGRIGTKASSLLLPSSESYSGPFKTVSTTFLKHHSFLKKLSFVINSAVVATVVGICTEIHARESVGASAPPTEALAGVVKNIRLFEEPLLPSMATSEQEDSDLLEAIAAYKQQSKPDNFDVFAKYLEAHPRSGWRVSLFTNLGLSYYHYGYFSKALSAWEQAFSEGRNIEDPQIKALVDRAVGELVRMHARLGHSESLAKLLEEIETRPVSGPATEAVTGAREGLWQMHNEPGTAFLCGPKALKNLMLSQNFSSAEVRQIDDYKSGPNGVTLAQVAALAKQSKLPYKLAYRDRKDDIPIPSLVHWKVNHFAALVAREGDRYHLKDPTFGTDLWVTRDALDSESSGYFLLLQDQVAAGFRDVTLAEASKVYGMGFTNNNQPEATRPGDVMGGEPCKNGGMCGYNYHSMVLSLNLTDTPLQYTPAKGPAVLITLTYNQREATQPAVFSFFNVSPKWTINWLSYIADDPAAPGSRVSLYVAGGGANNYSGYVSATGVFDAESLDGTILKRTDVSGVVSYTRRMKDGSSEVYAQGDGATTYPRRFFLTAKSDAAGNSITLQYDSQQRLLSITDAMGQVTNFSYSLVSKPLLVTAITDPFGRSAQLSYDSSYRLQQITDAIGLTSQFSYDANSLINSMTTPYGTTQFAYGSSGTTRWLEITDPLLQTERAEFRHEAPGIGATTSPIPTGIGTMNNHLQYRNTFFWDKSLYPVTHTDYTKARIQHWLHTASNNTAPVLESVKNPLENRVWYNYPGQDSTKIYEGSSGQPSHIARVGQDGTTQLTQIAYNSQGNRTSVTDPMGRQTLYDYAPNGIDVIAVRQKTGSGVYTTTASFTYNSQHQPLTFTDQNGAITTYTYNAAGQKLTELDPRAGLTTYNYNPSGQLLTIVDANNVTATTFTYDSVGRVATRKDAANNTLTYQYDNFDRVTRVTYPDSTYYEYQYDKLDLASIRDRLGLVTSYTYNANRQRTSITDTAGRITQFEYYPNGKLKKTIDSAGNVGRTYDIQGRLTGVTDQRGVQTTYTYDVAGNRSSDNSPDKGLTNTYFDKANDVSQTVDGRAIVNNYTYDAFFPRLSAVSYPATPADNVTFVYDDPSVGHYRKGRLSYVNSAASNLVYSYDANGNVTTHGDLTPMLWNLSYYEYDALNRLSKVTYPTGRVVIYTRNALGQITQVQQKNNANAALTTVVSNVTYEPFGPVKSLTFGNGVTTTIQHVGGSRVSRLTTTSIPSWDYIYTYDLAGNITGMANQAGGLSKIFGYDGLDRVMGEGNPSNPYFDISYDYDAGGNRTLFAITGWFSWPQQYSSTSNRLTSLNGVATPRDGSGNMTARTIISAMSYNNANRLKQATANSVTTNYTYTGLGQRNLKNGAQIVHYNYMPDGKYLNQFRLNAASSINRAVDYIWLDNMPVGQVIVDYAANNVPSTQSLTYIHVDHLNTPVTMTNGLKVVVWEWDRDPYGVAATNDNPDGNIKTDPLDLRFPGQIYDAETKLHYNGFRYYDPTIGRYTQSDPIGLLGGLNTYAYVDGNPVNRVDPLGLWSISGAVYGGWGAGLIFGKDDCGKFFTIRVGVGAGGGISYDPGGTRPGGDEDCGCGKNSGPASGGISGGVYGEASGAAPWFTATKGVEAGAQNNHDGSDSFYGGTTGGISFPGSGGGLKLEGSAGAEFTFYGRKN